MSGRGRLPMEAWTRFQPRNRVVEPRAGGDIISDLTPDWLFLSLRYDIKGCEVSRWTDPVPDGSQQVVVLKDLNFEGQFITLGEETGSSTCGAPASPSPPCPSHSPVSRPCSPAALLAPAAG